VVRGEKFENLLGGNCFSWIILGRLYFRLRIASFVDAITLANPKDPRVCYHRLIVEKYQNEGVCQIIIRRQPKLESGEINENFR